VRKKTPYISRDIRIPFVHSKHIVQGKNIMPQKKKIAYRFAQNIKSF
jgi:hypothetical protein